MAKDTAITAALTLTFAQEFLEGNFAPWIIDLKPKVIDCSNGLARIDIPITPHIERVGRIVCGQAMGALADTTMVFACFAHLDRLIPVATTTLDTQFLRPASGEVLSCRAKVDFPRPGSPASRVKEVDTIPFPQKLSKILGSKLYTCL